MIPDGYIKRASSTIPFGYESDDMLEGYLKPIPEELIVLKEVAAAVFNGEISLGIAAVSYTHLTLPTKRIV